MTDILNIDRFHIGMVTTDLAANIMGIPNRTGYIQFVPAGVRTSLAYPTPIQTSKDFSDLLHSDLFTTLCEKHGEEKIFKKIKEDALTNSSPLRLVLENIANSKKQDKEVDYSFVTGIYEDGNPWNGVIAKAKISRNAKDWEFVALSSAKTKTVVNFVKEFEQVHKVHAKIAWNGGYILNPELVGKLGLPESYIGSPLGLLISDGKVVSAPLFNKPALLIFQDGKIDMQRVTCKNGIEVEIGKEKFSFHSENYNNWMAEKCVFFDLMNEEDVIPARNCVLIRLAGNVIKEVIKGEDSVCQIPVGLTLRIPEKFLKNNLPEVNTKVKIKVKGLEDVLYAVEAGPMLLNNGNVCINMEMEGWKKANSIKTQAARLDFTDMRGPKIAVGIDKDGNLSVLTINGRIRESVGATHHDMAEIMEKHGIQKAMGFDPGGSSTLVVDGKTLNISPYNSQYERNIYSLPPEPRAVSNAIIGYKKKRSE